MVRSKSPQGFTMSLFDTMTISKRLRDVIVTWVPILCRSTRLLTAPPPLLASFEKKMQKSLGAALYRKQDGQRRVIPYGSRALSATEWGKSMAMEKITEDIFPKCGLKFQCYSQGVFESVGALQYYSDDSVFCNSCLICGWILVWN